MKRMEIIELAGLMKVESIMREIEKENNTKGCQEDTQTSSQRR